MRHILILLSLAIGLSSCSEETERLPGYAVFGIDISRYQSRINWDTVARQGVNFAFVKATEGAGHQDTLFCHNWNEIKRVGIKRGAYHYFIPTIPAEIQAENFITAVDMETGDLPPVLDVESSAGLPKEILLQNIRNWLYQVEMQYSVRPIIYTHFKFYNKYIAGNFNNYPIWIAKYGAPQPRLASEQQWHFWQHGNHGHLRGIDGDVDFNVFFGSPQQLEDLCLGTKTLLSDVD